MPLYHPLPAIPMEKPTAGTFLGSLPPLPVAEDIWGGGVAAPSFSGVAPGAWPGSDCVATYESDWSDFLGETGPYVQEDKGSTFNDCETDTFDPFFVTQLIDADTVANGGDNPSAGVSDDQADRFRGYGDNWMDAQLSAGVARAFYRGAPTDGLVVVDNQRNPIPRMRAVNLTAAMNTPAAVSPETAIANLLGAYYGCRLAGGAILHVPPLILPFLVSKGMVSRVGQRFYGPGGEVVVSDPGMPSGKAIYRDAEDSFDLGGSLSAFGLSDGEAYCFVTGGVEVSVGAPMPLSDAERFYDVRRNRWTYLVEQRAIFRWDPACCFASAAFVPSPGTGEP